MGPGQKILNRVRLGRVRFLWLKSGQPFMAWVEFGKFSLKTSNFQFFSLRVKKKLLWVGSESTRVKAGSASYLLRVKSKLGSGQGPSLVLRTTYLQTRGPKFETFLWIFLPEWQTNLDNLDLVIWKFPLKISTKSQIGLGQKVPGSKTGWPLICCGLKVCSTWVRAHLYIKGTLFNYDWESF